MPFKSKRQRTFLKINHPSIYKRWKKKYGVKIKPKKRLPVRNTQTGRNGSR